MPDPQATPAAPLLPPGSIVVDVPGEGPKLFPSMDAAKAYGKQFAADKTLQLQGDGPSIGGMLKKLLTPEAAGLAGFALGGPVGAGFGAAGMSAARNLAQGEPVDPFAAGEHALVNAAPGALANVAGRIPAALARGSGANTGGSVMRALGEILGGGAAPTAEDLSVGGAQLTRKGPVLSKGEPLLSSGTHGAVGQLATDAENAVAGGAVKGAAKADMARRARQLTEAFDAIGTLRKGSGGELPAEIAAILKANGLNPKTIQDLWHQRIALGAHGALATGAGSLER